MRRSNREMSKGAQGASPKIVNSRRKPRLRGSGAIGVRPAWLGLIASLILALPGFAQTFIGNHEFRGNAFSLNGASKTADGSAGVDGTSGAVALSIPIAVPPGTGGLAPTLSLNYSSDQGDGPFGLGWSLPLGEIRCTVRFGVPEDFANCAEFEFDGQLLVGPDTRPGMEGRYHTQVESFQKIVLQGTGGSAYWEVTSPGGTRRLYGETGDSKIRSNGHAAPPTAPIARWLLSKIVDLHGNEILITYDRSDVGVAYPDTISYALGEREVTFLYENRPDKILDFPGGIPRNITKRLREIEVKSLDRIFSRRLITYSASGDYPTGRSRIVSTQLFGKGCEDPDPVAANCPSLPAQTYEYTEMTVDGVRPYWEMAPSSDWSAAEQFIETGVQTYTFDMGKRLADVNGDGLPDLVIGFCHFASAPCKDPGEGPVVYINTGSNWVPDAAWTTAIDGLTYEAPTLIVESAMYTAGFENHVRACNATPGEPVTRRISFATDQADWMPIAVNGNLETFAPWPSWHLVDINGDGFADLVSSIRGGSIALEFDCAGNPRVPGGVAPGSVFGGELAQKIFLNNGTGWIPAPVGMAESLPPFQTQTIVKHMGDMDSFIPSWVGDCDLSGFLGGDPFPGVAEYCTTYMDLQPRFVELNGDGLLDIIILDPDDWDGEQLWLDDFYSTGGWWVGPTSKSVAWIQDADGGGWTPAPNFSLPFPHIQHNWIPDRSASGHGAGGMQVHDSGVYFVDLNRDGLTDIVKDDSEVNGSSPAAVILGTGTGWCNDLGDWFTSDCDTDITHSRYVPPGVFNKYTRDTRDERISKSEQLVFGDLNGDGFVDLLQGKDGIQSEPNILKAWLHDPSAPPHPDNNDMPWVWIEESRNFKPPTPFYPGTQFVDLDGNGTMDILHGFRLFISDEDDWITDDAYLSPGTHGDLLASVDNGRGGITTFTYVSAAFQRDAAMESEAEAYASSSLGDADGNSVAVTRFIPNPVISAQTVSGVGIAANVTTRYRYARPRFDPVERSGLGFGLIETTNPDDSSVDAHFYQREGLVGKPSVRKTFDDGGNQIHHSDQSWALAANPGGIPGAMAGVDVARLVSRESYNVYGQDERGASQRNVYSYDDTYGYNFLSEVTSFRATGSLTTTLIPDVEAFDETKWLVGLLGEKKQHNGAITYSREVYDYTMDGQIESRHSDIGLRDGTAVSDVATTSWIYDSWGNVTSQTDTRGGGESDRVVEFCYDGDGGGNSWCPSVPGIPDTHSLRVGLKDAIGGVVELEYDWVTGAILLVERRTESDDFRDSMSVVRDAFGRSKEQWFRGASFGGGDPDVLFFTTTYHDAPAGSTPAYVEQFQYVEESGGTPIRSARYLDGFGNALRDVAETPSGYRGNAVFRDPVAGTSRWVGPIDCDSDAACSNISETTEPAMVKEVDAAGRVIRITSPDGQLTQLYSWMARAQPAGSGTGDVFDTIEITNPNHNTTRRLMDGNRVVWADECQDSGCASFDATFYTYEASGEISTIYDALANDPASPDYTSPERSLRYQYDRIGRVIRTDEPNTGPSYAKYDHQGNVISVTNVRGRTTKRHFDALGRILKIDRLAGEGDPEAGVGEWDLTFKYDHPTSRRRTEVYNDEPASASSYYRDAWRYDDYGNVTQQVRTYSNDTLVMDFTDHDLLGRPARIDYPSENSSASYAYDGAYLTKVCRGPDVATCEAEKLWVSDVQYDGLGRRESTVTLEGTLSHEYYGIAPEAGGFVNALKRVAITAGDRAGAVDENYQYNALGSDDQPRGSAKFQPPR